ncbi:MAG: DNA polymerase I [Desulfobacteraceae bacterium]|nr:DNA polymerase I [Desulfobacteraceae bacterium]
MSTHTQSAETTATSNDNKELYLIDGTAYIYRAFHAVRGLANSRGMPTNAVFGFTRMLMKLMEDRQPTYVGMCFDAKGPTFRHKMYADYKANRPPMPEDLIVQLDYIKKVTRGFNIPVIELQGYEADDLIGTYARLAEAQGFSVVMVTGDKDFMQLVTPGAIIWDPMKEKTIDISSLTKDFGIAPHQIIDMMGLSGDTSDNIPGVPGIGPKTALQLIQTFGDMEQLYENVDTITKKKQKENLIEFKDQAILSKSLVTINTKVAVDFNPKSFVTEPPDMDALTDLFKELEFRQLQQEFKTEKKTVEKRYRAILTMADFEALAIRLENAPVISMDTETTSRNPMEARLVGLSFAIEPHEAFYIPCAHNYIGVPDQLSVDTVLTRLKPIFLNPDIIKVGQNIKYDWIVLRRHGADLSGVGFDTMLASYLLNPSKRAHNLDQIALDFLGHKTISYADVAGKGKSSISFSQVTIKNATPYAAEDADITLMAKKVFTPELENLGLTRLLEEVEMPLVPVLLRMEMNGINVDRRKLREMSRDFEHQLTGIEDNIYTIAGERFNIKSSQQLGYILFEKLGLPVQKKTRKKTGYSTDVEVLTSLAEQHELPALILRHRTLAKLKTTYADALLELIHPDTGRIHTSYNQTVAATGRLSSSDPNLQNIPIRTEEGRQIRSAFIPETGWKFISADYSQIELRILAHCADDPILIQSFKEGEDIHTRTASEVFQVAPESVSDELRRQAKAINFGIIYGMSAFGLSKTLGISQQMAKTYIDNYFEQYQGVKTFMKETVASARESRQTSTLMGRIRQIPDIASRNHNVRMFAERTAINTPIQGTAADLIKVAMIKMDDALLQRGLKTAMLLSVHDEILFESPPDEIDTIHRLVREVMENVWDLKVPLKVNVAMGENWAEAH